MFKRCIYFIIALLSIASHAQQPYSMHLNNLNGLPSNVVFDVMQDSKGWMWLATNDGFYNYDGFQYKEFRSASQSSVVGSSIQEDRFGRVWYENFDGYIFYVFENQLYALEQNKPAGFIPYGITKNHLFVVQQKGIDVYDLKSLKFLKTILIPIEVPEFACSNKENFYFITDDLIYKIDQNFRLSSSNYFKDKQMRVKYISSYKEQLYVYSKANETKELYFFDTDLNFTNSFPINELDHIQSSNTLDDKIWLHSSKGTFVYTDEGEFVKNYFGENSSSAVIKDHQFNYWFASINNGIYLAPDLDNMLFKFESTTPSKIIKINEGYVLGTQQGRLLSINSDFKVKEALFASTKSLPIYYIYHDSIDNLMAFSEDGFKWYYKNKVPQFQQVNVALKDMVRIDQKYYAYAASGFVALVKNPDSPQNINSAWDTVYMAGEDPDLKNTSRLLKGVRAKSIDYKTNSNELIVATNLGVYIINPTKYFELQKDNKSFYAQNVFVINDEVYLFDTKGILYLTKDYKNFKEVNSSLGVGVDIRRIKRFGNSLVINSDKEVFIYDGVEKKIEKLDFSFPGNRVYDVLLEDEYVILLSHEGVLKVSRGSDQKNSEIKFYINRLRVNNEKVSLRENLSLPYNANEVTIDFSVIEFGNRATPVYYRINSGNWVLVNKETRSVHFPSLSPDDYLIEFKVGDQICKNIVAFKIKTAFWKTWWFYSILLFIIGGVFYSYFKWHARQMDKQIQLLNEKVVLEKNLSKSILSAIKSQMNPHFFYNALNTIQAYIFTNDKQKANAYLAKFSKLTRIILEMSEKESVSLGEDLEALRLYMDLEKMRFSEELTYEVIIEETIDKESIEIPPMLLQPFVENAVKHGLFHKEGAKLLRLTFQLQGVILKVTIEDNGIGRKKSNDINRKKNEKHQSFATEANEKRLEILNQGLDNKIAVQYTDKYDAEGKSSGTRVELFIPI